MTKRINSGKDKAGRDRMHTVCGLLMHSSLAVTTAGLPLPIGGRTVMRRYETSTRAVPGLPLSSRTTTRRHP